MCPINECYLSVLHSVYSPDSALDFRLLHCDPTFIDDISLIPC